MCFLQIVISESTARRVDRLLPPGKPEGFLYWTHWTSPAVPDPNPKFLEKLL